MNLELISVSNSLNQLYLRQGLLVADFDTFRENTAKLLHLIRAKDSEETLKSYINNFLRHTYYGDKFLIKENHNNIDLVILNGDTPSNSIGVIVETKAFKSTEMIGLQTLNQKSFYEVIFYYMRERHINANTAIKHIIITNSTDWFIFDATEFERIFYKDKVFRKSFDDCYTGKLVGSGTDWFYCEIAKPYIENSTETIRSTYVDLSVLNDSATLSDQTWVELYKIFSPAHLLKLPIPNDSNTINRPFYIELLHILGLQEHKDKIERLDVKNRNRGSLIENIINVLETDNVLMRNELTLSTQNIEELSTEEQLFSVALELAITWLNRIVFIKLLENQIINYNDNQSLAFLNSETIANFDDLKEVFFDVLAVPPSDRKPHILEKYGHIPYLNSSLFEQSEVENATIQINYIKHNAALPVFGATVLTDAQGKKKVGNVGFLEYLLQFLNCYNFANDNKVEIQEQNKTLINSSVLGLIFEKINGYKDGSFYTPGYITMHICRETIRKAVVQKFSTVLDLPQQKVFADNWIDLYNRIDKLSLKQANEIFNTIRICDPSVGSGHFLVSALNEMLAIKSELGILIDADGKKLRNIRCTVQNDELFIAHDGQLFQYNYRDHESQRIQETLFAEKRTIIENCLFGVDINPKSVNICRLRLWIELLKNAYYKKDGATAATKAYMELETLPNIDINIKCGNSLINRFALSRNSFTNGILQKLRKTTTEYKTQVALYKATNDKRAKNTTSKIIAHLKAEFENYTSPTDQTYIELKNKRAQRESSFIAFSKEDEEQWKEQMARLDIEIADLEIEYNNNQRTIYSQAFEWRFEFPEVLDENGNFVGFDAVVGNPPYISFYSNSGARISESIKNYFLQNFAMVKRANERVNTMNLFVELATRISKPNGSIAYILNKTFAVLPSYINTRKFVLENTTLHYFITDLEPFEAIVDCCIIGLRNSKTNNKEYHFKILKDDLKTNIETNIQSFVNNRNHIFKLIEQQNITKKINAISTTLRDYIEINRGVNIGGCFNHFLSTYKRNEDYYNYISGTKCIKPYIYTWEETDGYMIFDTKLEGDLRKQGKTLVLGNPERYKVPRLFIPESGQELMAAFADETCYSAYGIMVATQKNKTIDLKVILALLNSKLLRYYVVENEILRKGNKATPHIGVKGLNSIPIPNISTENQKRIIELVDGIVAVKKNKQSSSTYEAEIDAIVYKLYNLDLPEINIVEKENTTRKE